MTTKEYGNGKITILWKPEKCIRLDALNIKKLKNGNENRKGGQHQKGQVRDL